MQINSINALALSLLFTLNLNAMEKEKRDALKEKQILRLAARRTKEKAQNQRDGDWGAHEEAVQKVQAQREAHRKGAVKSKASTDKNTP